MTSLLLALSSPSDSVLKGWPVTMTTERADPLRQRDTDWGGRPSARRPVVAVSQVSTTGAGLVKDWPCQGLALSGAGIVKRCRPRHATPAGRGTAVGPRSEPPEAPLARSKDVDLSTLNVLKDPNVAQGPPEARAARSNYVDLSTLNVLKHPKLAGDGARPAGGTRGRCPGRRSAL